MEWVEQRIFENGKFGKLYQKFQNFKMTPTEASYSLYLAKVMAIPDFFQEFLSFFIQENSKISKYGIISYGELKYAPNDTN
jgi:uncharacterized membrane protein (DUF485 family)